MTELLTRPPLADTPPGDQASRDAALWWRGCLAALWAVALGVAALLVVVLVVWAADSRSGASAAEAIRSALLVWLAAHKVALHTAGGELAVAPLGLTVLVGLLVARAAAVLARGRGVDRPAGVALVAAAVGLPYAVLSSFVAAAAHSSAVAPAPLGAL